MPRHSYTLVTAPAAEPVGYPEVKAWCRIDSEDDKGLVEQLITTARMIAEEHMRNSLITQTWKLTLDLSENGLYNSLPEGTYNLPASELYGALPKVVELPKGPVQSVTSVVTYDTSNNSSTFDSSNYLVDTAGARLSLNFGSIWPASMRVRAACEITYKTGYGDNASNVPQPIKTGIMIHVAAMYEQRGQSADAMGIPPDALSAYARYRRVGNRI